MRERSQVDNDEKDAFERRKPRAAYDSQYTTFLCVRLWNDYEGEMNRGVLVRSR